MNATTELFDPTDDGVLLRVHVQPAAGRDAVVGRHGDALKVRVRAPATDGRANEAVVRLIAETFGLPATAVELVAGPRSRAKRIRLHGVEAGDVSARIATLLGGGPPGGEPPVGDVVHPGARSGRGILPPLSG